MYDEYIKARLLKVIMSAIPIDVLVRVHICNYGGCMVHTILVPLYQFTECNVLYLYVWVPIHIGLRYVYSFIHLANNDSLMYLFTKQSFS